MHEYESPIKIIYGQMQTQFEDDILKAVQSYHIEVNKEELLKALRYDREQFDRGWSAGYANGVEDGLLDAIRQWISVEDRLPSKQHDWVLVACKLVPEGWHGVPHIAELRNGVWWADCYDTPLAEEGVEVTHWMPLPEPPNCGADMRGEVASDVMMQARED